MTSLNHCAAFPVSPTCSGCATGAGSITTPTSPSTSSPQALHECSNSSTTCSRTAGRLTTRTQPMATVDVQQVLDSVLADLNGRISESGAAVHIDRLPVLNADQTELAQVFANVMRNALTSSPPTPHRRCRRLPD